MIHPGPITFQLEEKLAQFDKSARSLEPLERRPSGGSRIKL
jgi:hypothetical protein